MKLFFAVLGIVALIVVPFKLLVVVAAAWLVFGLAHIALSDAEPPELSVLRRRAPTPGEVGRAWLWAPAVYLIGLPLLLVALWWGYRVEEEITAEEYEEELADIREERKAFAAMLFGKALAE